MFIALLTGRTASAGAIGMLLVFVAIFILVCEHVVPTLIVRRNPERVARSVVAAVRRHRPVGASPHQRADTADCRAAAPGTCGDDRSRCGDAPATPSPQELRGGPGADRGGRAKTAAVDRRLRRHPRARSDDAASRHGRDCRRSHAIGGPRPVPGAGVLANSRLRRKPRQHPRHRLRERPDPVEGRSRARRRCKGISRS